MPLSRKLAQLLALKKISTADMIEALRAYNLLSLLPQIVRSLKQIGYKEHVYDTLLIESPFAMNEKAIAHVKRLVGNDLAPHEVSINTELLAGFKARFKGKVYDGSAQRIIKQLIN